MLAQLKCVTMWSQEAFLRAGARRAQIMEWICVMAHWTCVRQRLADTNAG